MKTRINNIFKTNNYKLRDKIYNRYGFDKKDRKDLNNIKLNEASEDDILVFFDIQKLINAYELSSSEVSNYFIGMTLPNKSLVFNTTNYRINYDLNIPMKVADCYTSSYDIGLINYIGVSSKITPIGDILLGSNGKILKEDVKSVSLYDFLEEVYSIALQANEYWTKSLPEDFIDRLKSVEVKKEEVIKWMEEPIEE